jgi:polyketide synthase PksN
MINEYIKAVQEVENFARLLLLKSYRKMGVFHQDGEGYHRDRFFSRLGMIPRYRRLNDALLEMMRNAGFIECREQEIMTTAILQTEKLNRELEELESKKESLIQKYPNLKAQVLLLWACLSNFPEILRGEIPATDIMFPNSSMELVEGVYKGNVLADYFNAQVAGSIKLYIETRLPSLSKGEKIKILETGAGTGGTSTFVLDAVKMYGEQLQYVYTDISAAFTLYGEKTYGTDYPFMKFKVLDVEKDAIAQGFEAGDFEIIMAANVLHATRSMPNTLQNIKPLVKRNGWLVLNELTEVRDFSTLTFGLLEGWWLSEDVENRLPGSPLISTAKWEELLKTEGFRNIVLIGIPTDCENHFSQHVIISESNGMVRVRSSEKTNELEVNYRQAILPPEEAVTNISEVSPAEFIEEKLVQILGEILHIKREKIDMEIPFWDYGIDSILVGQVVKRIEDELGVHLKNSDLFSYGTIKKLSNYMKAEFPETAKHYVNQEKSVHNRVKNEENLFPAQVASTAHHKVVPPETGDIAVIGMAGCFPGAGNIAEYWENLSGGKDCITEIPPNRWALEGFYDPNPNTAGKSYCKYGGFLADADKFEPLFFNLSPKQAELMDPRQRLFLQEAWRVFEDAGYSKRELEGKKCGVFVGCEGSTDYFAGQSGKTELNAHYFLGNSNSILAARISYLLDLKGPSITIDTACSSSLVALHLACESIRSGSSELAIAGGVQIITKPGNYILLSKMGMLSPDGKCKAFDNDANGFVPGETVAVILLKPLASALQDGDHLYGVIKGSGVNQDGKSNGITAPNQLSQVDLESEVYQKYQISPETISYVETHGTGTKLGDPIEFEALKAAFRKYTGKKQYCAMGSVKSNIGHAGPASGIAGAIKVLLALKHKQLPPSLHFRQPNDQINFSDSPFYVVKQLQDWAPNNYPRRAAISSFGHSGTNCHIVMEEAPTQECAVSPVASKPYYPVVISAETGQALSRKIEDLKEWLTVEANRCSLRDLSYTLLAGRSHFTRRLALVVKDVAQLKEELQAISAGNQDLSNQPGPTLAEAESNVKQSGSNLIQELSNRTLTSGEYREKLLTLTGFYVKGYDLEWEKLFAGEPCRRISLPAYPFAGERYWLEESPDGPEISRLHPLLGQNTSTLQEQKFTTRMTGDEFYLADHVIGDQKVLPGVAYLEMARAAGELAGERKVRKIKNIVWVRTIALTRSGLEVNISLNPGRDGVEYLISTLGDDNRWITHSQGKLSFEGSDSVEAAAEYFEIEAIKGRCVNQINGSNCYRLFKERGMNLGESFQVVRELYSNQTEALAWLQLPQSKLRNFRDFILHPSLMDGALQTMVGTVDQKIKSLHIPYAMEELEIMGDLTEKCYSYVTVEAEPGKQGNETGVKKFNVRILDETGKVLVKINHVLARPYKKELEHTPEISEVMFFQSEWKNIELNLLPGNMALPDQILLFDTNDQVKNLLTERLSKQGVSREHILLVKPGKTFGALGKSGYEINPKEPGDYRKLMEILKQRDFIPSHILHLWSQDSFTTNRDHLSAQLGQGIYSVFYLTRALQEQNIDPVRMWYVFGSDQDDDQPQYEAVSGFGKSIHRENPKFMLKTIGVTRVDLEPSRLLNLLLPEIQAGMEAEGDEVRYREGHRLVKQLTEFAPMPETAQTMHFKENGVYLITGGAGGLGIILAEYLAKQVKAKLVLTGRTALNSAIDTKLRKIRALGSEVIYLRADVSNQREVEKLIREIKAKFAGLNGIIHSAGIVRDALVSQKTGEEMEAVLAPKVYGAIHLDEATQNENLDFLVFFSSLSGMIGNPGQCDYSYGNRFMDCYAGRRESLRAGKKRSGKTLSISWPLWQDGGMKVDEKIQTFLAQTMGITPFGTDTGLRVFTEGLGFGVHHFMVVNGNRQKLLRFLEINKQGDDKFLPIMATVATSPGQTAVSQDEDSALLPNLIQSLKETISKIMKVNLQDIDPGKNISAYGFDSISFVDFSNQINGRYHLEITPALFFEYSSVASLAQYLIAKYQDHLIQYHRDRAGQTEIHKPRTTEPNETVTREPRSGNRFQQLSLVAIEPRYANEPIAIIGMSGVMPQSEDLEIFWKNLEEGNDLITEIPGDRWDWRTYYGDPVKETNKTNIKWGGFMREVDKFDALFFKISPREARLMDPQHRIFLETVWKTIEDAGYKPSDLSGTKTGLFVGVASGDYGELQKENSVAIEAYSSTGLAVSVLANRISFLLNLHGPSEPIDTACSSSLVAIHRGVGAIRSGDCEMAIVGGVNAILSPTVYISFSKAGMLCPDGRCKTFDKNANGYARGEGVGAILLKPLRKAEADGDHIYAVVKGSSENHGGNANSLTAPNPNAQAEVIFSAYQNAQVDLSTVSYIEAHGTGTSLGDPIEINGLKKAYEKSDQLIDFAGKSYCGVGSVKTNIGHLEAAAGIAGIIKVLLAMKYGKIPGNPHFKELNPYIQLQDSPFYIVEKLREWERLRDREGREIPRRAGVSSFGFGGANAHIVLEEYPKVTTGFTQSPGPNVIVLSARNEARLKQYAGKLAGYLEDNSALRPGQVPEREILSQIRRDLLKTGSEILQVNEKELDVNETLKEYGLDPMGTKEFRDRINDRYHLELDPAVFAAFRSIESVTQYLSKNYRETLIRHYHTCSPEKVEAKQRPPQISLAEIAYTLQTGREAMEERLAVVAANVEELVQKLHQYEEGKSEIEGLYQGNVKTTKTDGWLIEGQEAEGFIKSIIQNGKLNKLAQMWISGVEINWKLLYPEETPRRISLPSYPFARERYWIPESSRKKYGEVGRLHPLIDRVDSGLSLDNPGVVFQKIYRKEEPIVRDHTINGQPILPGVGHLEMACAAIAHLNQGAAFNLSRVVWLSPLAVGDDGVEVRVVIKKVFDQLQFEVISGTGPQTMLHSKGMVHFITVAPEKSKQRLPIEEIKARCPHGIDKEKFYSQFRKTCVTHGPFCQSLSKMYWNSEEALGILDLPPEFENEFKYYTLHPTLMDGALQASLGPFGFAGDFFSKGAQPMVPFAIEQVEIINPLKTRGYAYIKVSGDDCFQVVITDETGLVCVKIHDVVTRKFKDPLQDFFYIPGWKRSPLVDEPLPKVEAGEAAGKKRIVLLIYPSAEGFGIEKALSQAHAADEVINLKLGAENRADSHSVREVKIGDPLAFDDCIRQLKEIDLIYFMGGIRTQKTKTGELEIVGPSQEVGVLSLFRLIKSLSRNGLASRALQLKVVTNNVYEVIPGETIIPYAASLAGFTKSIAKEYPKWRISCIDISFAEIRANSSKERMENLIKPILAEPGNKNGEGVAIRRNKRYVRSIEPVVLPPVSEPPFKEHGVYLILGGAGGIGLELSRYLAETVQARLVLIGRSELNAGQKAKISQIESKGGKVLYLQADATDLESMQAAIRKAKSEFGGINGVIHSAIVLQDKAIENMDEEVLRAVLAPKVRGSVVMHQAFQGEPLDFMMFFSSAQSFTGNAGQSNYAAACTFKDAFAHYLNRNEQYDIKIINWGYWGEVGVVATADYNKRLAVQGIHSIKPEEGLEAVRRVLAHPVTQIIPIKAEARLLEMMGIDFNQCVELYPENMPSIMGQAVEPVRRLLPDDEFIAKSEQMVFELERFSEILLLAAFQKMGVLKGGGERYDKIRFQEQLGVNANYNRLFEVLLKILAKAGYLQFKGSDLVVTRLVESADLQKDLKRLDHKKDQLLAAYPEIKAYLNLLWVCVSQYPDILSGKIAATDIIFPNSSMELVEGIYRGNRTVDYFNSLVVLALQSFIGERLPRLGEGETVRILEVGAGTGGTSSAVFEGISRFGEKLHYLYTDISSGFTQYGKKQFGKNNPFVEFKVLNIESAVKEQGFFLGEYDVVIATNVLHATRKIPNTLYNIKTLLKTNGWLILNESTNDTNFVTLTFGLLEGWWLYGDEENRLSGSPLLNPEMWDLLLKEEGFEQVHILGPAGTNGKGLGQNVIIAESNGRIRAERQKQVRKEKAFVPPLPVVTPKRSPEAPKAVSSGIAMKREKPALPSVAIQGEALRQYVEDKIIGCVMKTLGVGPEEIHLEKQFSEYGVDSISGVELVNGINETFKIGLRTTAIFDYGNVKDLSGFITENHGAQISAAVSLTDTVNQPAAAKVIGPPQYTVPTKSTVQKVRVEESKPLPPVNIKGEELRQYIEDQIIGCVIKTLGVSLKEIELEKQFSEYGVDSISGVELVNNINEVFQIGLRTTAIFDYGNVKDLSRFITENHGAKISEKLRGANAGIGPLDHSKRVSLNEGNEIINILGRLRDNELNADEAYRMMEEIYG